MDKIRSILVVLFSLQVVVPLTTWNLQLSLFLLPILLYPANKNKNRKLQGLSILFLFLVLEFILVSTYFNNWDHQFIVSLLYMLATVLIYFNNKKHSELIKQFAIIIFGINGILMLYEVLFQTKLLYTESTDIFIGFYRSSGLSTMGGAFLSVCYAVIAYSFKGSLFKTFIFLIFSLVAGRTGIFLFLLLLFINYDLKRLLLITIVSSLFILSGWSYLSSDQNKIIYRSLEFIVKYKESGNFTSSSSETWLDSWRNTEFPDNFLFGNANYGMRSNDSGNKLPFDIGWVRLAYGGGIFITTLFLMLSRIVGKKYFKILLVFNFKELALYLPAALIYFVDD